MVLRCIDKLDKLYFLNLFAVHGMDNCFISAYVPTIETNSVCLFGLGQGNEASFNQGEDIPFLLVNLDGIRHFTTE